MLFYNACRYSPVLGRFVSADTVVPAGVQGLDRYAYVNNNPLRYNDPSGHWAETLLDIAFIAYDIYDISQNGLNWGNGLSLAADVAGAALPFVTGGGMLVRAATHADDVADALKVINAADNVLDAANAVDNALDAGNALDNVAEIANVVDNIPCSFSAETDVLTPEGAKDIAVIEIGDHVLAWNEADGTFGYYEVTATFSHEDWALTELILDGELIETTSEHPFYVEGKGWTPADELRTGDKIRQADGTTGRVWLKWSIYKTQEMYNLTVDTAHTFFVGEGQWLVHNACPAKLSELLHPPQKSEPGITALGSRTDTLWVSKNLPEVRTLVDVPDWTPKGNIQWLDAAMRRGDEIWLLTDPGKWRKINPKSFYFEELRYLEMKNYKNVFKWFD